MPISIPERIQKVCSELCIEMQFVRGGSRNFRSGGALLLGKVWKDQGRGNKEEFNIKKDQGGRSNEGYKIGEGD